MWRYRSGAQGRNNNQQIDEVIAEPENLQVLEEVIVHAPEHVEVQVEVKEHGDVSEYLNSFEVTIDDEDTMEETADFVDAIQKKRSGKANKEILKRMKEQYSIYSLDCTVLEEETKNELTDGIETEREDKVAGPENRADMKENEDKSSEKECKTDKKEDASIPKSQLQKRLECLILFRRDSKKPLSALLYGVPGVGKSYVLEKIAKDFGYNYQFVSATDFKSEYHGKSEALLKEIFEKAHKDGPTILVIDEVDSMISKRDGKAQEDSEVTKGTKNLLLNLLSGTEAKPGVFAFFTTNHPWVLDQAFLDRMTITTQVKPPTRQELFLYLLEQTKELGYQCSVTFEEFSKLDLDNFNYRRIDALLISATEKIELRSMNAPHLTYLSRSPIRVTGCYCPGTCDKTDKKLRDFSSDEIRCGTITFSDISKAKEEGHIRSTTNSKDIEKLNHFEKYGKVLEVQDSASKAQEKSNVVSMQDECEWGGLIVTAIIVFVVLILIAKFGNF